MSKDNYTVTGPQYRFGNGKVGVMTGTDSNDTPTICLFNNEEAKQMDVDHDITGVPEFGTALQFPTKESINRVITIMQKFRDKTFGGAQ